MGVLAADWREWLVGQKHAALMALREAAMGGDGGEMDERLLDCDRVDEALRLAERLSQLCPAPAEDEARPTFGRLDEG
jgi:methyl coenzyme M reductase beta subunit